MAAATESSTTPSRPTARRPLRFRRRHPSRSSSNRSPGSGQDRGRQLRGRGRRRDQLHDQRHQHRDHDADRTGGHTIRNLPSITPVFGDPVLGTAAAAGRACWTATTTSAIPMRTASKIPARRSSTLHRRRRKPKRHRGQRRDVSCSPMSAIPTRTASKTRARHSSSTMPAIPTMTARKTRARRSSSTSTIRCAGVDADDDGFNDGDVDHDGSFDVGETWQFAGHAIRSRRTTSTTAASSIPALTHDNTATATTTQTTTGSASASVDDRAESACRAEQERLGAGRHRGRGRRSDQLHDHGHERRQHDADRSGGERSVGQRSCRGSERRLQCRRRGSGRQARPRRDVAVHGQPHRHAGRHRQWRRGQSGADLQQHRIGHDRSGHAGRTPTRMPTTATRLRCRSRRTRI